MANTGIRPRPDFAQSVPLASIPATGVLAGHIHGAAVLLARLNDGIHAVSGTCTHYGAALAAISGHYAAGDVARYRSGADLLRVEHWVHVQRHSHAAAANMLGAAEAFADVPFFWTRHYGQDLRYTGYAAGWDEVRIDGDLPTCDFTVRFLRDGRLVAAASVGRDLENLAIEAELHA